MDKVNINMYKDGERLIVVFENATQDLETLVSNLLQQNATPIPHLEPMKDTSYEKPQVEKTEPHEDSITPSFVDNEVAATFEEQYVNKSNLLSNEEKAEIKKNLDTMTIKEMKEILQDKGISLESHNYFDIKKELSNLIK